MMRLPLLVQILSLLACCALSSPPPTASSTGRAFAERLPGVENLARVAPGLYRGAQPSKEDFARLRDLGVRTVINLRSNHDDKDEGAGSGMELVDIPMHADVFGSTPPSDADVKKFFETALDPAKQPVYFHCAHGKDRTGTMAALWRIEVDGWTPEEAIEEMHAFGYHTIYKDLVAFVRAYRPRGFRKC